MQKLILLLTIFVCLTLADCSSKSKKPVEIDKVSEISKASVISEAEKTKEIAGQTIVPEPAKTETGNIAIKNSEPPIKIDVESPKEEFVKIGIIDLQKVAEESIAGKKATDEYNTLAKLKQEVIDEKRKAIENLRFNLEIQKAGLSDAAMKKKLEEIDRLETELERFGQDSEKELDAKYNELYNIMLQEILTLSNIIGEKEKYTLILDKGQILYGSDKIDITDLFINKYDETKKPVSSGAGNNPQK
jgi:outer membrane protein